MNKKLSIIVLVIVVLVLALGGYYYWKTKMQKSAAQQAAEDIQKAVANISADIGNSVSPDVTTPAVNLPSTNANPYSKTNPF
ncbi:MAG: hypothetical protein V1484_00310, partial [bacterium]